MNAMLAGKRQFQGSRSSRPSPRKIGVAGRVPLFCAMLICLTQAAGASQGFTWEPWQGRIPADAVIGGQEPGRLLPVCRAPYDNGRHMGKIVAGNCNFGWGGREIVARHGFEVLVAQAGTAVRWGRSGNGRLPAAAWPAGIYTGGRGFVCRAAYAQGLHPGKVANGRCSIGWGGREAVLDSFEVLMTPKQWAKPRPHPHPVPPPRPDLDPPTKIFDPDEPYVRARKAAIEAGPIWSTVHARQRCPVVAADAGGRWTGEWWTTVWGRMSVCEVAFDGR